MQMSCAIYCSYIHSPFYSRGIEQCLINWARMPSSLFAKAWIVTGHATEEDILNNSNLTKEDLDNTHLLTDPLELSAVLGGENAEEPSVEELIMGGELKRQRVVWLLQAKDNSDTQSLLPQILVFPLEKRFCNYLYMTAKHEKDVKAASTIVISRRTGKEISAETLRKNTILGKNNLRKLKPDAPRRTSKDSKLY